MTKSERQATLFQELQPGPSQDFVEWYRWTPDYLLEPPGPPVDFNLSLPEESLSLSDLQTRSVAVFGLGAVGGEILSSLAKLGVDRLIAVDPDNYEEGSWQTQPALPRPSPSVSCAMWISLSRRETIWTSWCGPATWPQPSESRLSRARSTVPAGRRLFAPSTPRLRRLRARVASWGQRSGNGSRFATAAIPPLPKQAGQRKSLSPPERCPSCARPPLNWRWSSPSRSCWPWMSTVSSRRRSAIAF